MYGAAVSQMSSWLCQKYAGTLYWLFSRLDHIPSKSWEKPKINCVSSACIVFLFWVALRTALRYTPDIHMGKKKRDVQLHPFAPRRHSSVVISNHILNVGGRMCEMEER